MCEILKVKDAVKYYGNGSATTKALDGVSFTVQKGEFVAVMGASGSGKTTLLNAISTIERLSSGEISIGGDLLQSMSEKKLAQFRRDKLGFIFQEYNLLDTLTAGENVALPLKLQKIKADEIKERLEKTADDFGLVDELCKFPYELSGGQRQRVACARAVITNPSIILADEPTGALDSRNSKLLMERFTFMNGELGATILMVTHDPVMSSYASRVLFLRDGRIFSEVIKGDRDRKEFYRDIIAVTASLGGEADVV